MLRVAWGGGGGGGDYGSLKLIDASCSFCPLTVTVKLRVELFSLNSDTLTRFFFIPVFKEAQTHVPFNGWLLLVNR